MKTDNVDYTVINDSLAMIHSRHIDAYKKKIMEAASEIILCHKYPEVVDHCYELIDALTDMLVQEAKLRYKLSLTK